MRVLPITTIILSGVLSLQIASADEPDKQTLINRIRQVMPDAEISAVNPSPLGGLYEVIVGKADIIYMSADGRYVLKGDLLDLNDRRNLTEDHRKEARLNALKSISPDTMIEFAPPDNTKYVMYVYTDVDCAYCRKFHQEVGILNKAGIAVRYLAFPRAGVDSESYRKSVSVWCAKDRNTALTEAKAGKSIPAATCKNPVKEHYESGIALGVKGTPTIILQNGVEVGGYAPADKLVEYITNNPS